MAIASDGPVEVGEHVGTDVEAARSIASASVSAKALNDIVYKVDTHAKIMRAVRTRRSMNAPSGDSNLMTKIPQSCYSKAPWHHRARRLPRAFFIDREVPSSGRSPCCVSPVMGNEDPYPVSCGASASK